MSTDNLPILPSGYMVVNHCELDDISRQRSIDGYDSELEKSGDRKAAIFKAYRCAVGSSQKEMNDICIYQYTEAWRDHINAVIKSKNLVPASVEYGIHKGGWIEYANQKPERDQYVWYFFEHTGVAYGQYEPEGHCFYGRRGFLCSDVTHWMPAPPPPAIAKAVQP